MKSPNSVSDRNGLDYPVLNSILVRLVSNADGRKPFYVKVPSYEKIVRRQVIILKRKLL